MSTEKNLWARVRRMWRGHAVRIEASEGGCDPGTPDTVLSIEGRGCWVELKVWPEPLRETQLPWHIDAIQRGAGAWVLCDVRGDIWLGSAEEYRAFFQWDDGEWRPRKVPNGSSLQAALNVVACGLTG